MPPHFRFPPGVHFRADRRKRGNFAMFRWVIKGQLAGGPRPRVKQKPTSHVPRQTVDAWLRKAKITFAIRSIICLLDEQQLRLYADLRVGLAGNPGPCYSADLSDIES